MKKSILNLGKALDKAEQKQVNGGTNRRCTVEECQQAALWLQDPECECDPANYVP